MKPFAKISVLLILVLLWTSIVAFPQSESGRLIGTVTDASGAAVAGATIKVTQLTTNRVVSVQSQGDGKLRIEFRLWDARWSISR